LVHAPIAAQLNSVTTGYVYDSADRLLILAHSTPTDTLAAYAYLYDASGNRAAMTETVRLTNTPDLIREAANGFETGTLSAWTDSENDSGDLSASTASALVGSRGKATAGGVITVYIGNYDGWAGSATTAKKYCCAWATAEILSLPILS
jgi:hypothetical protein